MPVGAALSEQSSGESVTHFSTIRVRAVGHCELRIAVYSLDDLNSKILAPMPITKVARFSPTRIVNFVEQRASFALYTMNKGERFRINRIVIFTKELYKSYPGS